MMKLKNINYWLQRFTSGSTEVDWLSDEDTTLLGWII